MQSLFSDDDAAFLSWFHSDCTSVCTHPPIQIATIWHTAWQINPHGPPPRVCPGNHMASEVDSSGGSIDTARTEDPSVLWKFLAPQRGVAASAETKQHSLFREHPDVGGIATTTSSKDNDIPF